MRIIGSESARALDSMAAAGLIADQRFTELFIYAFAFAFLIILLFIISRGLKLGIGSKVKGMDLPFGLGPEDMEKLKKSGQLTEEELKRVKQAMSRQIVERAKAEEAKRQLPEKAEIALQAAEAELVREALKSKFQEPPDVPSSPPSPAEPAPSLLTAPLSPALESMRHKSDIEIDELMSAGFLSSEDAAALRRAREARR